MSTQPASTEHRIARPARSINELKGLEGPLLPILHGIQDEFGYVPAEALPVIAEALNISNAEVHGVVTFYHDYRNHPAGRHVLKICRAEACQSMGGDAIAAQGPATARHRLPRDDGRWLGDAGAGLLPRPLRLRAGGHARRRGDRPARRRQARRDRRGGAAHDRHHLRSRRFRRAGARRREGRQGDRSARSPRAASTRRSCATARAACYWLEPLVEVETGDGRVAYGPVDGRRMCRRCSTPASSTAATHQRCRSAIPRRFRSSRGRRG